MPRNNYIADLDVHKESEKGHVKLHEYFRLQEEQEGQEGERQRPVNEENGQATLSKNDQYFSSLITDENLAMYTEEAFAEKFQSAKDLLNLKNEENLRRYNQAIDGAIRKDSRQKHHRNKMADYADKINNKIRNIKKLRDKNSKGKNDNKKIFQIFELQMDNITYDYKYDMHLIKLFGKKDAAENTNLWVALHTSLLKKKKLCDNFATAHPHIAATKAFKSIANQVEKELIASNKDRSKSVSYEVLGEARDEEALRVFDERAKDVQANRTRYKEETNSPDLEAQAKKDAFLEQFKDKDGNLLYKSIREYDHAMLKQNEETKDYNLRQEIETFDNKMLHLRAKVNDGVIGDNSRMFKANNINTAFFEATNSMGNGPKVNQWKFHLAFGSIQDYMKAAPKIAEDFFAHGIHFKLTNPNYLRNADLEYDNLYGKHITIYPDPDFARRFEALSQETKNYLLGPVIDGNGKKVARVSSTDRHLKDANNNAIRITARYGNHMDVNMLSRDNKWVYDDRKKTAKEVEDTFQPIPVNTLEDYLTLPDRILKHTLGEDTDEQKRNILDDGKLMDYAQAMVLKYYKDPNQKYLFDFYKVDKDTMYKMQKDFPKGLFGVQGYPIPHAANQYVVCVPNEYTLTKRDEMLYYLDIRKNYTQYKMRVKD